jgi:hypothetical protein
MPISAFLATNLPSDRACSSSHETDLQLDHTDFAAYSWQSTSSSSLFSLFACTRFEPSLISGTAWISGPSKFAHQGGKKRNAFDESNAVLLPAVTSCAHVREYFSREASPKLGRWRSLPTNCGKRPHNQMP